MPMVKKVFGHVKIIIYNTAYSNKDILSCTTQLNEVLLQ